MSTHALCRERIDEDNATLDKETIDKVCIAFSSFSPDLRKPWKMKIKLAYFFLFSSFSSSSSSTTTTFTTTIKHAHIHPLSFPQCSQLQEVQLLMVEIGIKLAHAESLGMFILFYFILFFCYARYCSLGAAVLSTFYFSIDLYIYIYILLTLSLCLLQLTQRLKEM